MENLPTLGDKEKSSLYPDIEQFEKLRDKYSPQRRPTSRQNAMNSDDIRKPPTRSTTSNKAYELFAVTPQRFGNERKNKFYQSNFSGNNPGSSSTSRISERPSTLLAKYPITKDTPLRTGEQNQSASERRSRSPVKSQSNYPINSPTKLSKISQSLASPRKEKPAATDSDKINVNLLEKLNETKIRRNHIRFSPMKSNNAKRKIPPETSFEQTKRPKNEVYESDSAIQNIPKQKIEEEDQNERDENDNQKRVTFNNAVEYNDTFTTTNLKTDNSSDEIPSTAEGACNKFESMVRTFDQNMDWIDGETYKISRKIQTTSELLSPGLSPYKTTHSNEMDAIFDMKNYLNQLSENHTKIDNKLGSLETIDSKFGSMIDLLVKFENKVNKNYKRINGSILDLNAKFDALDEKLNIIFGKQMEILHKLEKQDKPKEQYSNEE